jgi:hypothetical protein
MTFVEAVEKKLGEEPRLLQVYQQAARTKNHLHNGFANPWLPRKEHTEAINESYKDWFPWELYEKERKARIQKTIKQLMQRDLYNGVPASSTANGILNSTNDSTTINSSKRPNGKEYVYPPVTPCDWMKIEKKDEQTYFNASHSCTDGYRAAFYRAFGVFPQSDPSTYESPEEDLFNLLNRYATYLGMVPTQNEYAVFSQPWPEVSNGKYSNPYARTTPLSMIHKASAKHSSRDYFYEKFKDKNGARPGGTMGPSQNNTKAWIKFTDQDRGATTAHLLHYTPSIEQAALTQIPREYRSTGKLDIPPEGIVVDIVMHKMRIVGSDLWRNGGKTRDRKRSVVFSWPEELSSEDEKVLTEFKQDQITKEKGSSDFPFVLSTRGATNSNNFLNASEKKALTATPLWWPQSELLPTQATANSGKSGRQNKNNKLNMNGKRLAQYKQTRSPWFIVHRGETEGLALPLFLISVLVTPVSA